LIYCKLGAFSYCLCHFLTCPQGVV
jgi:hypothetical protein